MLPPSRKPYTLYPKPYGSEAEAMHLNLIRRDNTLNIPNPNPHVLNSIPTLHPKTTLDSFEQTLKP